MFLSYQVGIWHPSTVTVTSGSLPPQYRVLDLRYRAQHSISKTSILNAHSISTFCTRPIEGIRYRRSHYSISKVTNLPYRRSWIGLSISKFHISDIEHRTFDIACRYRIRYGRPFSCSISKVMLYNIRVDIIVHDIAFTQCHSLRSRSSLFPGCITPAPKSLSATSPGFLHPLFAEFHSLIHRDLTRKGPSIAPHPHVDFEKPAPSPAVGS